MRATTSLMISLVVVLVAIEAQAKPHGNTKAHPHEITNRMAYGNSQSSTSATAKPTDRSKPEPKNGAPAELKMHQVTEHNIKKDHDDKPSDQSSTQSPTKISTEKDATTKPETEDGIPMENERLIHVTAKPVKPQKSRKNPKAAGKAHNRRANTGAAKAHHKMAASIGKKKAHHKTNSSTSGKPHHKHQGAIKATNINVKALGNAPANSKVKANKPTKKYNSKKHGWKKSNRKEKSIEKKEKRERRVKKVKAMQENQSKTN